MSSARDTKCSACYNRFVSARLLQKIVGDAKYAIMARLATKCACCTTLRDPTITPRNVYFEHFEQFYSLYFFSKLKILQQKEISCSNIGRLPFLSAMTSVGLLLATSIVCCLTEIESPKNLQPVKAEVKIIAYGSNFHPFFYFLTFWPLATSSFFSPFRPFMER